MESIGSADSRAAKSKISFRHSTSNSSIPANEHFSVEAMSDSSPIWRGLHLEVGSGFGWRGDELMVPGHVIGMNLSEFPLRIRLRVDKRWLALLIPSKSLWIIPEGTVFSTRVAQEVHWATAIVDGEMLDNLLGGGYEFKSGYGIVDKPLSNLYLTLIELLREGASPEGSLIETLVSCFIRAFGRRHGVAVGELRVDGGISPHKLRSLLHWIAENYTEDISVRTMALRMALSPAHFSREFKRSTALTPWEHVVELRLQKARELLMLGESARSVAAQCGFCDHSHLSRQFKGRFGMLPSAVRKRRF